MSREPAPPARRCRKLLHDHQRSRRSSVIMQEFPRLRGAVVGTTKLRSASRSAGGGSPTVPTVGGLRCVDGSSLTVNPVPSHDRGGTPYEVTLELIRDGVQFGSVGERCGYHLASLAGMMAGARAVDSAHAALWPDPDDRFPDPPLGRAVRMLAAECGHADILRGHLPREPELFAFRHRDRGDLGGAGELRCTLRTFSTWVTHPKAHPKAPRSGTMNPPPVGRGRWRLARRAVVEAWGERGWGVRAILTSGELEGFLADLLSEAEHASTSYRDVIDRAGAGYRDVIDWPSAQRYGR
jgi:hypothetical protein